MLNDPNNQFPIGWQDIRDLGYENYDEYLHCIEEEEDGENEREETQFTPSQEMESDEKE